MNPGLTWMVAIFWIAGNPDSGAVDGYPHCGGGRISARQQSTRDIASQWILRRSECRFRAPNGRVALRRTNVCLEGSTPPRASSRSVICIDKAGSEIVHASAACPKWPCQRIEMAKLPKRDLGHQKNLPRRSIKSILPYRMGSVGCRGNRVKCRLHTDPGGNHANQDRRQYG
jgi:hypothetical protein